RTRARRRRRQGPRDARPRHRHVGRRRADRDNRRADGAPHRPPARGSRARDGPARLRRAVQLDRRLAHADEDAPHARARRPRHARRRDGHRRPHVLRERRRDVVVDERAGAARRLGGRRDALRARARGAAAHRAGGVPRPCRRHGRRLGGGDARAGARRAAVRGGGAGERCERRDRAAGWRGRGLVRVVVVALGKIGLPLAAYVARAGHAVVGCDVDPDVVALVNAARAPFPGEAGLEDALAEVVGDGRLRAQTDTAGAVAEGVDLVIAVPPLVVDADARPDWRILDSVVADVGRGLGAAGPGRETVVCIETTLPVGTTRTRIAPGLAAASGLHPEHDFFVAFSPERVYSGRIFADLGRYPKLVGGCSERGEELAVERYRQFVEPAAEVWPMGSAEAAELAKLAETTYRDLNIAFANELARHADAVGVDVDRVIEAANSQPFSHVHRPGVAVGGHCIPVYPHFFLHGAPEARLPALAREVNGAMPA